jgi:hypothetical protein
LGIGALLWSIPVASIQALATADQIGKLPLRCLILTLLFLIRDMQNAVLFFISAAVPGMAWIATLNGGDVSAFVSILIFEYTCLFLPT